MIKFFSVAVFLLLSIKSWTQVINVNKLEKQISLLNADQQYEAAILKLDSILNDEHVTAYDRSQAYLQKSLTYKRVYNYPVALINLELAGKEKVAEVYKDELAIRVLIEKLFIHFDLQQNQKVSELLEQVDPSKLNLIKKETKAFYLSILAVIANRKKDYVAAEAYLMEAKVLLEKESPEHLPNVYRVLMVLYSDLKNKDKVFESYELGMYYAEEYNMEIYKIIMEETMTKYYADTRDYENAFNSQKKVSQLRTRYSANNHSGKLGALEKELFEQRKSLAFEKEKALRWSFILISMVLAVLLLVLWRLFVVNRHRRLLIEEENNRMRSEIELIVKAQSKSQEDVPLMLEQFNLSSRQLEIIDQVRLGKTNKEIGAALFISENTVKYHLKAIYEILNVYSRAELTRTFIMSKPEEPPKLPI